MTENKKENFDAVLKATSLPFEANTENAESNVKALYDDWAQTYEEDLRNANYNGPQQLIDHFISFNFDKNCKILDVLGGTGVLAKMLRKHGYANIDNLDASKGMMLEARKHNLYKQNIVTFIGGDHTIPLLDDTYDYAILCGGFTPGHVTSDIFPEIIRVLKPGGMFMWAQAEKYILEHERLKNFHEDVQQLVADGHWKQVTLKRNEDFVLGRAGFLYAMQKLQT